MNASSPFDFWKAHSVQSHHHRSTEADVMLFDCTVSNSFFPLFISCRRLLGTQRQVISEASILFTHGCLFLHRIIQVPLCLSKFSLHGIQLPVPPGHFQCSIQALLCFFQFHLHRAQLVVALTHYLLQTPGHTVPVKKGSHYCKLHSVSQSDRLPPPPPSSANVTDIFFLSGFFQTALQGLERVQPDTAHESCTSSFSSVSFSFFCMASSSLFPFLTSCCRLLGTQGSQEFSLIQLHCDEVNKLLLIVLFYPELLHQAVSLSSHAEQAGQGFIQIQPYLCTLWDLGRFHLHQVPTQGWRIVLSRQMDGNCMLFLLTVLRVVSKRFDGPSLSSLTDPMLFVRP
ncbi:hypothetical protein JZ751_014323 [Albula glossodonta]|uniref:Uncharacterized protein n=1 Tax=Albula glossodonta TaxID=121402 RepID=A0A8T2P115_9TELE|nr:hypothetical protein JZ751_014323 [Albula glossodonta]